MRARHGALPGVPTTGRLGDWLLFGENLEHLIGERWTDVQTAIADRMTALREAMTALSQAQKTLGPDAKRLMSPRGKGCGRGNESAVN